jgi:hypothetical protein
MGTGTFVVALVGLTFIPLNL